MSDQNMIEGYSDEALQGAMEHLRRAGYLGTWGKTRLEKLMAEERRRKLKRRGTAQ